MLSEREATQTRHVFARGPNKSEEACPSVTIQQSPPHGRAEAQPRSGDHPGVTDAYEVRPERVQVFIHEVDHEKWAKAEKLAIDR